MLLIFWPRPFFKLAEPQQPPGPALCFFLGILNTLVGLLLSGSWLQDSPVAQFLKLVFWNQSQNLSFTTPIQELPLSCLLPGLLVHSLITCDSPFEPQSFTVCLITVQFSYSLLSIFLKNSNNKNKNNGNNPHSTFPFLCLLQPQGASLLHPVFTAPVLPALVSIIITVTEIPDINNLVEEMFLWVHSPSWCGGRAPAEDPKLPLPGSTGERMLVLQDWQPQPLG